jgi:nicotinamidase-related amidase
MNTRRELRHGGSAWKSERKLSWIRTRRALVIVDMQVEGCQRHGPGVKPVIGNIRRLLDRFRSLDGKIIHVQSVRTKDHPEFTVFGRPYGLLIGSPGADFVEELKPLPGENVVQKTSHDCFYKTTMETVLQKLDLQSCRDKIVVTGIGSSNCVYHAVIGFHIRNFYIIVPEDCIHGVHPQSQPFALHQFRSNAYNFNVTVSRSEDLTFTSNTVARQRASGT